MRRAQDASTLGSRWKILALHSLEHPSVSTLTLGDIERSIRTLSQFRWRKWNRAVKRCDPNAYRSDPAGCGCMAESKPGNSQAHSLRGNPRPRTVGGRKNRREFVSPVTGHEIRGSAQCEAQDRGDANQI